MRRLFCWARSRGRAAPVALPLLLRRLFSAGATRFKRRSYDLWPALATSFLQDARAQIRERVRETGIAGEAATRSALSRAERSKPERSKTVFGLALFSPQLWSTFCKPRAPLST